MRDRGVDLAYFPGVRRDGDDARRLDRWSELPPGDPHRDVTGALHDVSNALTVLLGWISEVRAGASPADLARAMTIIEDRARSARDLARRAIGAHDAIDERERPIGAVVTDVVEALSVEAQRARVKVSVSGGTSAARLPLAADASQVLTNVVMNALAWAPPGTRVSIDVVDDASGMALIVSDEGPGVAPGQVDRIFGGVSNREGGAGVGLKHARAVARAAGGDLTIVHRADAQGACFRIDWPRSAIASTRVPRGSRRRRPHRRRARDARRRGARRRAHRPLAHRARRAGRRRDAPPRLASRRDRLHQRQLGAPARRARGPEHPMGAKALRGQRDRRRAGRRDVVARALILS